MEMCENQSYLSQNAQFWSVALHREQLFFSSPPSFFTALEGAKLFLKQKLEKREKLVQYLQ
jgi:hypothetical protein